MVYCSQKGEMVMRMAVSILSAGLLVLASLSVCFAAGAVEKTDSRVPMSTTSSQSCGWSAEIRRIEREQTENGLILRSVLQEDIPIFIKQFVIEKKNITK